MSDDDKYKRSGSEYEVRDKRIGSKDEIRDKRSGSKDENQPSNDRTKKDQFLKDLDQNHQKLIEDNVNHAIEQNSYLAQMYKETDKEKRFRLLKKYFTENITSNLYQKMDLLYSSEADFDHFKDMYFMVGKFLFMNILLATDTLVNEKGKYKLDLNQAQVTNVTANARTIPQYIDDLDGDSPEYSICETYMRKNKRR
jgi:hypothetical protein